MGLGVFAALLLAGCGSGKFNSSPAPSNVFRYAMSADITTLDPAKVQDVDTMDLLGNVFEGLVAYDENNKIVGRIAESWSSPDSGKTWIFKIRSGAKFHNGRQVAADDVKWSFERSLSSRIASPTAANYLRDIIGADKKSGDDVKGIQVIDAKTVSIELDKPRAYFLGKITYACASVLPKESVGSGAINDSAHAIGTGPFKLAEVSPGQYARLTANKDYYLGAPKLELIERPIIMDAATRLNKFKAGQLDMLTVERSDLEGVQADPNLSKQLSFVPRPAIFYLGLNQLKVPVLRDERVRKAIALALDRKKICDQILHGMPQAKTLIAPGVPAYRSEYIGLPYDPEGAKQLLADAGYPGGKGFPVIPLAVREKTPDSQAVAESIESQLRTTLGIQVKPQVMQWGKMLADRNKGQLDLYLLSWYADYVDAQNFLSFLLTSDSSLNHDGYKNEEFDRLCRAADTTLDEASRTSGYQKAEDIAVLGAARIPIYFGRDALLINPRVTGLSMNLMGTLPHLKVVLK